MKRLTLKQVETIDLWIKENARLYDKAKWNNLFHNGTKANVVKEMVKYQNEDGGFGNGFEADILLPLSAPLPSAEAIFQAYDYDLDCNEEWFSRLLCYFEKSVQSDNPKFWEDAPKEVMDYPHAPWWNYGPCTKFSPNPCAVIASAMILYGSNSQKELGITVTKKCFEHLLSDSLCGDHDCYNIMKLIEKLQSINSQLVTDEIIKAMKRQISENVCYDTSRWCEYYPQPLDFVDMPESMWYQDIEKGVNLNFEYWLENINNQGVWNPNFSWEKTAISLSK